MMISKEARSAACEALDQAYFHDAKDSDERLYLALMAALEAALSASPQAADFAKMHGYRDWLQSLMFKQPTTEERDTYSDGFKSGLLQAIEDFDRAFPHVATTEPVSASPTAREAVPVARSDDPDALLKQMADFLLERDEQTTQEERDEGTRPECQSTAGCKCNSRFGVNFTWGHVKDLPSSKELAALREENARLRNERDELNLECQASMTEIANLRNDLQEARNKAIEECAQIAATVQPQMGLLRQGIVYAIRQLKGERQP